MQPLRSRLYLSAATFALSAALGAGSASSAINVTTAKIAGGVMTVSGTKSAGQGVKLDDAFTINPNGSTSFAFNVIYHAEDCIVELDPIGGSGSDILAVVADCGPRGVIPRGSGASSTAYALNYLVTHNGLTWRALKSAQNKVPGASGNSTYWEKFAAMGDKGATGPTGPTGATGATGALP